MEKRQFTEEEVVGKIDASFDSVEKLRLEGLERTRLLHSVKNRALEKERERLSEKLGAEHPRIKKVAARIKYNQGMFKELNEEIEKASIKVPSFDKNTWMVHGRVLDNDRKGVSGLTVGLFDENGNWLRELGFGCTDKRGYFSIIYPKKGKKKKEAPEPVELFLCVSDKSYRILHKDDTPLSVKVGQIDYREICLFGEEICAAPEPGKDDTLIASDTWVIKGRVTDVKGQGIAGLTINPYDKKHVFDDTLGTTVTDEDGNFVLKYKTKKLRDLIEAGPGIYIKALDKKGKTLYASKKAVRYEPERIEFLDIKIKRKVKRDK